MEFYLFILNFHILPNVYQFLQLIMIDLIKVLSDIFFSPNNPVLFDRYYLRISLRLIKMGSVDEMIINGLLLVNLPVVVNHLELVLAFWRKQKNISVCRVYIITCRSKEISTLLLVMFFNILYNFFLGGGGVRTEGMIPFL